MTEVYRPHTRTYMCIYIYIRIRLYNYIYTHVYTYIYIYIHAVYVYIYMYTYAHVSTPYFMSGAKGLARCSLASCLQVRERYLLLCNRFPLIINIPGGQKIFIIRGEYLLKGFGRAAFKFLIKSIKIKYNN